MENYATDSQTSTPRSCEIDSMYELKKVKLMCSYGGKIQPRPYDNRLSYIGGDTKILTVERSVKFEDLVLKLGRLCGFDVCFKYQLPGEDLDALISVMNDEDLEHMMIEYDRLRKPARLRLFLFPVMGVESESGVGGYEIGMQRMQIASQEQVVYHHVSERSGGGDYYNSQRIGESVVHVQQGVPVSWQGQSQMTAGGHGAEQHQHQVYIVPAPEGVYQGSTNYGQTMGYVAQAQAQGQSYNVTGTRRMVPGTYQEQQIYSSVPGTVAQHIPQPSMSLYAEGMSGRQGTEGGYCVGVAYDGNGREVYYPAPMAGGGMTPIYQAVPIAAAPPDARFGANNQEGNMNMGNPN